MGKLHLVPTPIGNLADMTYRAVDCLSKVKLILVEDTRTTKKLLDHYGITTPMKAYHEHNKDKLIPYVLQQLQNYSLALVSDAGSPGISDPGFELVNACIDRDIEVIALPGPTALIPALTASGLATDSFLFLGFLGKKSTARQEKLSSLIQFSSTIILYESPYRVLETLEDINAVYGNRKICVAREISKKFESYLRGSVTDVINHIKEFPIAGEAVILIEGAIDQKIVWNDDQITAALNQKILSGNSLSDSAKTISKMSGLKKSYIYQLGLQIQNKS